jgi:hypothetical protein
MIARATLIVFALQLLSVVPALPHGDTPRTSVYGTAAIDGARSPGEWDAATVVPVLSGLPGSQLYLMNDEVNLYLALWVPDASLVVGDRFEVRFDSAHDGLLNVDDDAVRLTATGVHTDMHFGGVNYELDLRQDGSGAAGPEAGGTFFEIARPLNSGDPEDISLVAGETTAICVRYFDNNTTGPGLEFPTSCPLVSNQQSLYVDVTTVVNPVAVPGGTGASDRSLQVFPNPAARGADVEIRYRVPEGGSQVEIGVYTVAGRKVAARPGRFEAAGPQSWRWTDPARAGARPSPGAYLVRVRFGGGETRSALLFLR